MQINIYTRIDPVSLCFVVTQIQIQIQIQNIYY